MMVMEVLNMFKNELSCTFTRDCKEPLCTYRAVLRYKREDYIFKMIIVATKKYINYFICLSSIWERKAGVRWHTAIL